MPIGAAVALMILIVIVSVVTVSRLKKANYWREHTFQVTLDAQTLEDKLSDAQRSEHDYAADGKPSLLIEYRNDTNAEMQEINELTTLTRSDSAEQQRLKDLAVAVQAVFSNDNKVIGVYARQGAKPALAMDDEEGKQDTADAAINDLEKFTDDEKQLLNKEDATEQKDYHRAEHVLIIASLLAAILLVIANVVAGREIKRRQQSEAKQRGLIVELQDSLAEVKTLSGLIPICGWCKNVRNDKGYWSTVEQYVRSRTDATFSHGICPECREKFKAEIARANLNEPQI